MLRIAISQPEHFPYLGYFQKMRQADQFVLLDDVQFSGPRSFQNRNRLQCASGADEWFTTPVRKGSYNQPLDQVRVSEDPTWRARLNRKLVYHFGEDFSAVYVPDLLCEINIRSIRVGRVALGIDTPMIRSSSLGCTGTKTTRLRQICERLGADVYVCGTGGAKYLNAGDMGDIGVEFFTEDVPNYYSVLANIGREPLRRGLTSLLDGDSKA